MYIEKPKLILDTRYSDHYIISLFCSDVVKRREFRNYFDNRKWYVIHSLLCDNELYTIIAAVDDDTVIKDFETVADLINLPTEVG